MIRIASALTGLKTAAVPIGLMTTLTMTGAVSSSGERGVEDPDRQGSAPRPDPLRSLYYCVHMATVRPSGVRRIHPRAESAYIPGMYAGPERAGIPSREV